MTSDTELLEEAARRFVSDADGKPDPALDAWLEASSAHRIAYAQVCASWHALVAEADTSQSVPRRPLGRVKLPWLVMAGGLMLLIVAVLALRQPTPAPRQLADGITARLSSNIEMAYDAGTRRMQLTRGRAWIDVDGAAALASKPATGAIEVEIGKWRVRDIGTRFVVDADRQRLAVFAGAVEMIDSQSKDDRVIRLDAGESIALSSLRKGPIDGLERGLDSGQWILIGLDLRSAIDEIEREGARVFIPGELDLDAPVPNLILPDRSPDTALRAICAQLFLECTDLRPFGFVVQR